MKLKSQCILLSILMLSGCATPQSRAPVVNSANAQIEAQKQREMVIEDYMTSYKKLQVVASKVVVSGAKLCGDKVSPYFGISTWNQDAFQKEWKTAVQSKYGLTESVHIANVASGSVSDKAGLKEGDVIVSIDGWTPSIGKDAPGKFDEKLAQIGKYGTPVEFIIRRGAVEKKIAVTPTQACDFKVELSPADEKNAHADGKKIVIYKGMMDFFKTDEETALVVSHELAHNSMKHIDAQKKNALLSGFFGLLVDVAAAAGGVNTGGDFTRMAADAGARAYSVEFEQEADYVGLYFMANAGYRIDDAPYFWRRMATINAQGISMKSSHPTSPDRFVALESAVQEINQKIANHQPLKPEMKGSSGAK
ncbi:MAG: PDZ domain-containing protein [Methylotenera sp.]|nr:PDZ domain-containing protein [Methylotenera sp.]